MKPVLQLTTIIFLISFSMLAAIHALALEFSLYWHFFWFDIPMHFFGGAIVALGLFTLRDLKLFSNKHLTIVKVLLLVFSIALVWEGFELFAGVPMESDFVFDTSLDIVMGLLGGIIGFSIGNSLRALR
jgi:hypothetical protein